MIDQKNVIVQKTLNILALIVLHFFTFIIINIIAPAQAFALEPAPSCSSGYMDDGGANAQIKINLICENLTGFVYFDEDQTIANSQGIVGLHINPMSTNITPERAYISGDMLVLVFNTIDETVDRNVQIDSGFLINSEGLTNSVIEISTDNIEDRVLPVMYYDYYQIEGNELSVDAEHGVLSNDVEREGGLDGCAVTLPPTHGSVEMNEDGSFLYIAALDFGEDGDYFEYIAYDQSGNWGKALVIITDPAAEIDGEIYRVGPEDNNKYAKVGDILRVDFETNEAVTIDNLRIGTKSNLSVIWIDASHFYAEYILSSDDEAGSITFTLTAHDLAENQTVITTEDGVTFDKAPPVVILNSESYQELIIHSQYIEDVTAEDDVDGDIDVVFDGIVNTDNVGIYSLVYYAVDRAGNGSDKLTRVIKVFDPINDEYVAMHSDLMIQGYDNNLDKVGTDNHLEYCGLTLENADFRLLFESCIDLSSDNWSMFLSEASERIRSNVGEFFVDYDGMPDADDIRKQSITMSLKRLQLKGHDIESEAKSLLGYIRVFDENGLEKGASQYLVDVIYRSGSLEFKTNQLMNYLVKQKVKPPITPAIQNVSTVQVYYEDSIALAYVGDDAIEDEEKVLGKSTQNESVDKSDENKTEIITEDELARYNLTFNVLEWIAFGVIFVMTVLLLLRKILSRDVL